MSKKNLILKDAEVNEISNVETATVDQLVNLPFEYREENAYAATAKGEEEEAKILKGLEILKSEFGISNLAYILGKHWNDRPTWRRCLTLAKEEATKKGMTLTEFINTTLRQEIDKLDQFQAGISRLKYCFNYMKPRAGQEKDTITSINLNGSLRMISLRKFNELKESYQEHKDKEILIAQIMENSTESESLALEL